MGLNLTVAAARAAGALVAAGMRAQHFDVHGQVLFLAEETEQDLDAGGGRHGADKDGVEPLERAADDLHVLAGLEVVGRQAALRVDGGGARPQVGDDLGGQAGGHAWAVGLVAAKADEAAAGRVQLDLVDRALLGAGAHKEVAGEERAQLKLPAHALQHLGQIDLKFEFLFQECGCGQLMAKSCMYDVPVHRRGLLLILVGNVFRIARGCCGGVMGVWGAGYRRLLCTRPLCGVTIVTAHTRMDWSGSTMIAAAQQRTRRAHGAR